MMTDEEQRSGQYLPDESQSEFFSLEEEAELSTAIRNHSDRLDKIVDDFTKSFQVGIFLIIIFICI
jgi:hypothetical protein